MPTSDHYRTLNVSPTSTQAEIKQAYRRLAKKFHPDSNRDTSSHEKIARVNEAYEVLGDPESRRFYDQQQQQHAQLEVAGFAVYETTREQRTAAAQAHYRKQRNAQRTDEQLDLWLKRVYTPVTRLIQQIVKPLNQQIDDLAADPFDDELMEDFQGYLEDCRDLLEQTERIFRSLPNPPSVAGVAASLYYCLNQIGDGIEQLEFYPLNYDEHYLHTGQELFRIAAGLRREAQVGIRDIA